MGRRRSYINRPSFSPYINKRIIIMTLENARVLHKHYLEIDRGKQAKQLEERYPELVNTNVQEKVKKDGNDNTRRKKR